jgi:hypothetical protein
MLFKTSFSNNPSLGNTCYGNKRPQDILNQGMHKSWMPTKFSIMVANICGSSENLLIHVTFPTTRVLED